MRIRGLFAAIGLGIAVIVSNLNPVVVPVDTKVDRIIARDDGLFEVDCVVPHCEKRNCGNKVVAYFTTDDRGYAVGQDITVTINYGNDYEIVAVNGKELPEEWR